MITRHLIISGRVQGVGYRDWLRTEARARGLSGWVRNRMDGSVEALLAGEAGAVAEMIAACRRGPRLALVDAIAENEAVAPDEPGFHRVPTV
jgi:acylphosphatase